MCDLVLDYGSSRYDKHGGRVWFLTKKSLTKIERELGTEIKKQLERKKNIYVVESTDDHTVITAGYAYKTRLGRVH